MIQDCATAITDAEVGVVVQGPATETLRGVVDSVRRWLPRAQLVVSTWQGADVAGLDADEVLLNADPGSTSYLGVRGAPTGKMFNTNRMLLSTLAGLRRVSREYTVKLRNDTPLTSDAVLTWMGEVRAQPPRGPDRLRLFDHRVIMSNIAVRPSATMFGYLFHPSDVVHAGATSDLLRLWDVDLIDEVANARWYLDHPRPEPDGNPTTYSRYFNEQVLWLAALRGHGIDIDYTGAGHVTPELMQLSDASMVTNFECLEPWQLGLRLPFDDVVQLFPIWQYTWRPDWNRMVAAI